jgi:SnoaL-like protein
MSRLFRYFQIPHWLAIALSASHAQAPQTVESRLRDAALRIVGLETRRQETTGTAATIDSLLVLYSDSVVYEHPNVGAIVRGKAAMRASMQQFLGSIRNVVTTEPRIMTANGAVVVETFARLEVLDGPKSVPVARHGVRIIEFDGHGLVRRIIDYPW